MIRVLLRSLMLAGLVVVVVGGCDGADTAATEPSTKVIAVATTSAPMSPATTLPSSTTTTQIAPTTVTGSTLDSSGAVLHAIPDYGFVMAGPHIQSTFAPASGWVVTESPGEFRVWFPGVASPDTLGIGGDDFEGLGGKDWGAGVELTYERGVNHVPITVTRGTETTDVSVPVTYLPDATVTLAKVTAVDATSISLDYGYWDASGEFPSPADDDIGLVETVPVAPDAYVILDATLVADYAWFVSEHNQQTPHDDIGWYPGSDWTVYWATIDAGQLVELWRIPVG